MFARRLDLSLRLVHNDEGARSPNIHGRKGHP